jgi:hypothetical protein
MGLARQAGCADGHTPAAVARCLRALPVTALLGIAGFLVLPSYGNQVLPENPDQVLGTVFGDDAARVEDRVEERYPLSAYRSARHAWPPSSATVNGPGRPGKPATCSPGTCPPGPMGSPTRRAAPLFDYPPDIPAGASHGAELGYLFDRLGRPNDLDPAQGGLADRMIRYWARFARASDPNGPGLPRWPRYRHHDAVPRVQELGPGRVGPYDRTGHHRLEFWRDLG